MTDNPLVPRVRPNPTLYFTLETDRTIKWRWDWSSENYLHFFTGQLDEFADTVSGDKKLLALLYGNFLIGCLDTAPQRFLFGLLSDDSEYMQGVFCSSTADNSGVFLVKRDPGAAAGQHSLCVFFRQRGGQFNQKCVLDPDDKLRLYGKFLLIVFLRY
jgi:hypothetical protein